MASGSGSKINTNCRNTRRAALVFVLVPYLRKIEVGNCGITIGTSAAQKRCILEKAHGIFRTLRRLIHDSKRRQRPNHLARNLVRVRM
jgi:hypothetical protein